MPRLIIVANRLPITVRHAEGKLLVERSAGGLATGLKGPHEKSGGPWIGWPGFSGALDEAVQPEFERRCKELHVVPVTLSSDEVERFYEGYSNTILWPLFHYFVGQLPVDMGADFDVYERVNRRFADEAVRQYQPGDLIWVHDYQLMLVPGMIREKLPGARIGFFLHIPFPGPDAFSTLPHRQRVLEGLLGADLLGFHTTAFVRHFAQTALQVAGAETNVDRIRWKNRYVRMGVFPMGVDAASFGALSEEPEVLEQAQGLRVHPDEQILVGIDRLDYTKGIPRRLLAFERLLRDHPELRERVRLIQVAVPSRTGVKEYQDYREQVDAMIGRLHGEFSTPRWVPIHYIFRGLSEREIVALYRATDVMLVTPIRDGMNLVAKEFVATRGDESGVLVLSEFAGAAAEMAEAMHVNPYDIEGTAEAFYRALTMGPNERRVRMRSLRQRVLAFDVHRWAETFVAQLGKEEESPLFPRSTPTPEGELVAVKQALRQAKHRVILLDYDGTLREFARSPEEAKPDDELMALLRGLSSRKDMTVHIVSGRPRTDLDAWFGALPVGLHGEHGFWYRLPGKDWQAHQTLSMAWRKPVRRILEDFAARTPGALVEEKTVDLAWHYRRADPEFGDMQANELKLYLTELLSNSPVEVMAGSKVIELRPHGIHKGAAVPPALAGAPEGSVVAAFGDDRTDEDLFAALPQGAYAIHVGPTASIAPYRLAGVREARDFLKGLLEP